MLRTDSASTARPGAEDVASSQVDAPDATLPAPEPAGSEPTPSDTGTYEEERDRPPSPPRQILIPGIDVDASVIDLGLTTDGALETPTDFAQAGWWAGGTVADEAGPTVIVGHVDDQNGPAVFFRLQELEPGDPIVVVDDRGQRVDFVVVDKGLYDKDAFPTERVYGDGSDQHSRTTLRLVTCGGEFDRSVRSYEANWVIYAEAA